MQSDKVHVLHRSDQHFAINAAADNNITGTRPVFDSLDWSEDNYRMFEETGQTGKHIHICLSGTQQVSKQVITHV